MVGIHNPKNIHVNMHWKPNFQLSNQSLSNPCHNKIHGYASRWKLRNWEKEKKKKSKTGKGNKNWNLKKKKPEIGKINSSN
jgi:hypothetical protein